MFDITDKDTIIKLIRAKNSGEIVIPLYVKMYNKIYSILELDDITDFSISAFKVGFGAYTSFLLKDSFPKECVFDFDSVTAFGQFDEELNVEVRYHIFEASLLNGDTLMHKQVNNYFEILSSYVSNNVTKIKKEMIKKLMEE